MLDCTHCKISLLKIFHFLLHKSFLFTHPTNICIRLIVLRYGNLKDGLITSWHFQFLSKFSVNRKSIRYRLSKEAFILLKRNRVFDANKKQNSINVYYTYIPTLRYWIPYEFFLSFASILYVPKYDIQNQQNYDLLFA